MTCLNDEKIVVKFHATELGVLGLKQMPDGRVGRADIVRESEGDGLHGSVTFRHLSSSGILETAFAEHLLHGFNLFLTRF